MTDRANLRDAALVALGKAAVSAGVLASGFRSLSDDDFARVVIAQRFAEAPALDPSGTSWLPFPFWLSGQVMALFGPTLEVARATAFASGVAAAVALFVAARWLGLERRAAVGGALLGSAFPYAAFVGVATVPEALTAGLIVLGAASLSQTGWRRVAGGLALAAACLSRYEAWPVAAVFALFCLRELFAAGGPSPRPARGVAVAAVGLALLAPVAWLAHGVSAHGDALFFVKRVSEYRRALGSGQASLVDGLLGFPVMLLRCEPELVALAALAVAFLLLLGRSAALGRHRRVALALGALVAFLVAGDLRDGAPTHHAERALLAVWSWLALLAADGLARAWRHGRVGSRAALIAFVGLALAPTTALVRPWFARRDAFVDRSAEVAIGRAARAESVPGERLLVDTPDFAFFAVIAGFGAPSRAAALDDHDPRRPRAPDPFVSDDALAAFVARSGSALLVTRGERRARAERLGVTLARSGDLAVVRVGERR